MPIHDNYQINKESSIRGQPATWKQGLNKKYDECYLSQDLLKTGFNTVVRPGLPRPNTPR